MLGAKMSPTPYQPFSPQYNQIAQKLELQISDFTEKEQLLAYILQKNIFFYFITHPNRIYVINFNSKIK